MKINLPTKITLARIALIPLILIFYYLIQVHPIFSLIIKVVFIVASSTDAIDGHIARSRNMVTTLGKFLDPIADKSLVVAGLFIIVDSQVMSYSGSMFIGSLAMIGSVIIMVRELSISAFRQIAATKGIVMAADKLGKAKTIMTLIAIPALMLGMYANDEMINNNIINILGQFFLWLGVVTYIVSIILTIVSGINYVIKNKQVFEDKVEDKVEEITADNAQDDKKD